MSADGKIHTSEKDAKARDDDFLGEELDGLLRLFELDITRSQEYKALMLVLTKKRPEILQACETVSKIIRHSENDDTE